MHIAADFIEGPNDLRSHRIPNIEDERLTRIEPIREEETGLGQVILRMMWSCAHRPGGHRGNDSTVGRALRCDIDYCQKIARLLVRIASPYIQVPRRLSWDEGGQDQ